MITFLSGVAVGLVPFLVILAVAIVRSRGGTNAKSPQPQNSIQHVQEHVVAVKTNKNGEKHAY